MANRHIDRPISPYFQFKQFITEFLEARRFPIKEHRDLLDNYVRDSFDELDQKFFIQLEVNFEKRVYNFSDNLTKTMRRIAEGIFIRLRGAVQHQHPQEKDNPSGQSRNNHNASPEDRDAHQQDSNSKIPRRRHQEREKDRTDPSNQLQAQAKKPVPTRSKSKQTHQEQQHQKPLSSSKGKMQTRHEKLSSSSSSSERIPSPMGVHTRGKLKKNQ